MNFLDEWLLCQFSLLTELCWLQHSTELYTSPNLWTFSKRPLIYAISSWFSLKRFIWKAQTLFFFFALCKKICWSSYLNVILNKKRFELGFAFSFLNKRPHFYLQRWRSVLSRMAWSEPTFLLPCRKLFISHLNGFVCSTQVPRRLHFPACFEGRRTFNCSNVPFCVVVLEMFLHSSEALRQFGSN